MPVLPSVMMTRIVTGDRNVVTKDVDSNVLILSVCVNSLVIYVIVIPWVVRLYVEIIHEL